MKKVMNVEVPFRRRKSQESESLVRKMLRLLGIERASVCSVGINEEGTQIDFSLDYSYSKQNEAALLEAERKKAKALLEMQRQRMRFL